MMLIIPIFIPLIMLGMSALFEAQANKDIEDYNKIGFAYDLTQEEKALAEEMEIEIKTGTEEELKKQYENGEINLYVTKDNNKYILNSNGDETSTYSENLVETFYNTYKQILQQNYLQTNNINPEEVLNIITVETNIFEEDNFFVSYIKNYAFLFIITGLISLVLAIISLIIAKDMFTIYDGIDIMFTAESLIFAVIVIIAYSFFISGLCIAIASTSKTFKEAQSALTPLTFISFFPGMIAFMVGVEGTPLLSIIPFLNFTVIFTDINAGRIDYLNIFLMAISTIIYISIVFKYIIRGRSFNP